MLVRQQQEQSCGNSRIISASVLATTLFQSLQSLQSPLRYPVYEVKTMMKSGMDHGVNLIEVFVINKDYSNNIINSAYNSMFMASELCY